MGIFQNNILKPEELISGFAPNSDGDETFSLNTMDSYPGDLPDFAVLDSFVVAPEEIISSIDNEAMATESIFDDSVFGQSETLADDSIMESSDVSDEYFGQGYADSLLNPSTPESSTDSVNDIFAEAFPDSSIAVDDSSDLFGGGVEVEEAKDPDVPFVGELNNDDELEKMLRSAMDEEKNINEAESSINDDLAEVNLAELFGYQAEIINNRQEEVKVEEPTIINEPKEFQDIEDTGDVVEINLDVYPENISKAGINNKVPEPTPEPIPVIEEKQAKVKKPINKKLFKRIAYIAAAMLLIASAGVGVYYSGLVGTVTHLISGDSHSDTTEVVHNTAAHKSVAPQTEHKPAEHSQEATHDTNEQHNAQEAEKVTTHAENEAVHSAPSEQHAEPHKDAEVTHPKEVTSHKEKVQPTIEHKKEAQLPKAIKEKSKHETKTEAKPLPVHTAAKIKEKTPNKEKTTEKIAKVKSNEKVAMKTPVEKPITKIEPKPETEVYVIQIYASPSKEDAQEWLKKVQKRIGAEAYISTQLVRDKVWYRVRCGHYTSKESAIAAAEKYGFSQSWVDRIR